MGSIAEETPSSETTIVAPSNGHTHTIIFLHGREDFGSDLAQYFFDSKSSSGKSLADIYPSVRWVFPTADLRYSAQRDAEFSKSMFAEALKGEEIISQWFDLWSIKEPTEKEDLMIPGLQESIRDIVDIIKAEAEIVPLDRIVLGGISQGCATAILTLLSSGLDLGGFIGCCSWLPFKANIETAKGDISQHVRNVLQMSPEATTNHLKTPVFLSHSKDDETVPFAYGQGLHGTIEHLGFDATWKEYETGGHWIQAEHGVDDISAFLDRVLAI